MAMAGIAANDWSAELSLAGIAANDWSAELDRARRGMSLFKPALNELLMALFLRWRLAAGWSVLVVVGRAWELLYDYEASYAHYAHTIATVSIFFFFCSWARGSGLERGPGGVTSSSGLTSQEGRRGVK